MSNDLEFEQIDADAVCEQCGTVNPEETLLCKTCGNNLKEQRERRISSNYATPPPVSVRATGIRVLTGLLSVLGILVIIFVVLNLSNIEAALVEAMAADDSTTNVWSGETGRILDELMVELETYPSSTDEMVDAMQNALVEDSFNGRYVVVNPNLLGPRGILAEANLKREGDKVYFVAKPRLGNAEIRGVADLREVDGQTKPVVFNSASVDINGTHYGAKGFSTALEEGGHLAVGESDTGYNLQSLAYRIR